MTEYRNQCLGKITMQKYEPTDATPDMFPTVEVRLVVGFPLSVIFILFLISQNLFLAHLRKKCSE